MRKFSICFLIYIIKYIEISVITIDLFLYWKYYTQSHLPTWRTWHQSIRLLETRKFPSWIQLELMSSSTNLYTWSRYQVNYSDLNYLLKYEEYIFDHYRDVLLSLLWKYFTQYPLSSIKHFLTLKNYIIWY